MKRIALIYTTFLRDGLMYQTIQAILDNWKDEYVLMIADQGELTEEKDMFLTDLQEKLDKTALRVYDIESHFLYINGEKLVYRQLPFDCGLSYARNELIKLANMQKIEYCFLLADSLKITDKYDFSTLIEFLEEDNTRGIIGLDDIGRPSWERNIELVEGQYFFLKKATAPNVQFKGIEFQPIEICRNFFFAKTQCLIDNPWDNNLKMAEHEDFFYRLKKDTQYKVFYTNTIQCAYVPSKSAEYSKYRERMYNEFITKLQEKYKIRGWVKYER